MIHLIIKFNAFVQHRLYLCPPKKKNSKSHVVFVLFIQVHMYLLVSHVCMLLHVYTYVCVEMHVRRVMCIVYTRLLNVLLNSFNN